jgi:uncharacterized protein
VSQAINPHSSHGTDADVLYVAARAPRPGFTKTRLGRAIGHERATALYVAFVRDLAERLERLPYTVGWYVTPDDAWNDLSALVPASRVQSGRPRPILAQPPGDWTARQRALFATARNRRERRTVLIASDSPHLDNDLIGEAFERLWRDDLVLGPTDDGGYYLIGVRTPADRTTARPWDALSGVRMSTGTVLDEILARAAGLGLRTSLLSPTFDIDEAADLDRLIPLALARNDLAATRAALERLGLLRSPTEAVERQAGAPVALGGVR